MNRRSFLVEILEHIPLLNLYAAAPPQQPKWFTHRHLRIILNHIDGKGTRETVDVAEPKSWNNEPLTTHEAVYLAIIRMSNIMFRKTLDKNSPWWMVVSPALMDRTDIWPKYMCCTYTTPGKKGGDWLRYPWRRDIQEEVSPDIYKMKFALNCKWQLYVAEQFPQDKMLLGMGYKQVTRFRKTGKMLTQTLNEGTEHEHTYTYPEMEAYKGPASHGEELRPDNPCQSLAEKPAKAGLSCFIADARPVPGRV